MPTIPLTITIQIASILAFTTNYPRVCTGEANNPKQNFMMQNNILLLDYLQQKPEVSLRWGVFRSNFLQILLI